MTPNVQARKINWTSSKFLTFPLKETHQENEMTTPEWEKIQRNFTTKKHLHYGSGLENKEFKQKFSDFTPN